MTFPTTPEAMLAQVQRHAKDRTAFMSHAPDGNADGIDLQTGNELPVMLGLLFGRWIDQPQLQEGPGTTPAGDEGYLYDLAGLEADEDLGALRAVHEQALGRYREVIGTLRQVRDDPDPSLNHDGRLKIAARVIQPKLDAIRETAERELARTDAAIEAEMDAIARASWESDASALAVHPDVRGHFKALPDNERSTHLSRAITTGDRLTLQALTAGPAYLGGLTEDQHAKAQEALAALVAPDRVRRVHALRAGQKVATGAVARLQEKVGTFLNFHRARELLEHDARRQSEMG